MNRYLVGFLLFVGTLVIAGVALAVRYFPQVALFFDAERRDEPAYVFDFSRRGANTALVGNNSRGVLLRVVRGEGGRFHYHGELARLLEGELLEDEWQQVDIYALPAGGDYLRLATHEEYLRLDGGPASRQVLTAASDPAIDLDFHGNAARVIWLLETRADQPSADAKSLDAFIATAHADGATPAIRTAVKRFTGERVWNQLVVFEFRSEQQALGWFRSLKTRTALSVLNSRHVRTAGLLFRDVPI
jgi:uncharacterized protein (DUF1330 family)